MHLGIRRQVQDAGADGGEGLTNSGDLMGRQVVEDDYVAGRQSWRQKLLDIGAEGFAGHGAVEDHRRDDAGRTQACTECRCSPMADWGSEIGRAHVRTPATYAHRACRLLLATKDPTC